MARAIKHIKAGILHIEVLGQIPEPGERKRRAARCRSTSAAQAFYNAKASWRELELMIAANFAASDWVITYTYDNAHLPSCREEASKELQKYFRRLRTARRRRGDDLLYIYNIEGYHGSEGQDGYISAGPLEDRRIHHHVILNGCGPGDLDELRSLWRGGGYVRAERLDIHYYRELAKYMTKEAREFGTPRPGERTWRASRNLQKYEVEYEELRSSVTLAPPPGAMDYQSFAEQNPYGYAQCIGARYLLYEEPPARSYTYAGRRSPARPLHFQP